MINIPGQVGWKQTNRSDKLGSLWSTFNIDLRSNLGSLRISPRLKVNRSTSDLANLGCPIAYKPFNTNIYALAGGRVFLTSSNGTPEMLFTESTETGVGTDHNPDYSDMETFNDLLFASSPSALRSLDGPGGTWTSRDTFSNTSVPHKLCYFKKFNRLYYTQNDTFINSMGTDYSPADGGNYTLDWDGAVAVVDLKPSASWIWIAGKQDNLSSSPTGVVWQWDGVSPTIAKEYLVPGTSGVVAIVIDPETDLPVAIGNNGVIYTLTGGGFKEAARFPFSKLPYQGANPKGSTVSNDRFVHPNGLFFTEDGTLLINISNKLIDSTYDENVPSGVWEWSKDNGLYHKYSFSYDPVTSSITDYGQNRISRVGALALMNQPYYASGRDGTLLAGATLYTDASSTTSVIAYDNSIDTIQKFGYFVTTKIFSSEIEDIWQKVYPRLKKLLDSSDFITVKFRTSDVDPAEATITWTSATTCTTTTDVSAYEGYEMEVLQGKGGGKCSKITDITESGGTYTITLQETFTGATSGTAKARFQYWREAGKLTSQTVQWFEASPLDVGTWIQLKICMQFKGKDELNELIIVNQPNKEAK